MADRANALPDVSDTAGGAAAAAVVSTERSSRDKAQARNPVDACLDNGVTLGAKRNWMAARAKGSLHCNMDDDDIYLPCYLERMVGALAAANAELVKLGAFVEYNACTGHCTRYGSSSADAPWLLPKLEGVDKVLSSDPAFVVHGHRWGYGFSYVHTASLAWACP